MSRLIETHSARNPRLLLFYGLIGGLLLVLIGGMIYRQLLTTALYSERERIQNLRRVIVPGPRGNLYDRHGELLVGNRPRFAVVLNLAELRTEFRTEFRTIEKNYASLPPADRPSPAQKVTLARTSVAQRYLDRVNAILGRKERVNGKGINRHIDQSLLLPYILLDDLAPEEYARLIERLPVNSPVQVYTTSTRSYPHDSAAAHVLGYIKVNNDPEVEDFEGEDLLTFKMKGAVGDAGLEKIFDEQLQGETGGAIYLVDPAGYKVESTDLPARKPVQGQNLVTSLDLELQLAAETAMNGRTGAAVALDIKTGEVLVMASLPNFDPLTRVPNVAAEDVAKSGVWQNRAIQGQYPPGSTFKIVTGIAGLRAGAIEPGISKSLCPGFYQVGNRSFPCHFHSGHGERDLSGAIRDSCNVFFYKYGLEIGPNLIATEAKRFGFNEPTGIELPFEFRRPRVADPEWRRTEWKTANLPDGIWRPGDTANMAIGQGDTLVTPLQVACMLASFARGETRTVPTLVHDANRPAQHSAPLGLSPSDYNAVLEGMKQCYQFGTGKLARVDGLTGAAKSGTAQKGKIELAWLMAFAPAENPQIAVVVILEGAEGVNFGGGVNSGPVVNAILTAWKTQRDRPAQKKVDFRIQ